MININPYLHFPGNTEEAFHFYKSAFGGEFVIVQRFRDVPGTENMPAADRNKIMHIALPIGTTGILLMGTDALESMGHKLTTGNNQYINLNTESKEEADHLFNKLSAGGKTEVAMKEEFWGAYFGSFADKFGVQWMINYRIKK